MKGIWYVVFRFGMNTANQSMTPSMAVGAYLGSGKTAAERRADAINQAEGEHTVYNNQYLEAVPWAHTPKEDRESLP